MTEEKPSDFVISRPIPLKLISKFLFCHIKGTKYKTNICRSLSLPLYKRRLLKQTNKQKCRKEITSEGKKYFKLDLFMGVRLLRSGESTKLS